MRQRVILKKRPSPHESNRKELNHGNKSKEHFLKSLLWPLVEDGVRKFENDGIVDKVHEEEVEDDCPADLFAGFFNSWVLWGFPDKRVHSYPWEDLVYISHVTTIIDKLRASKKDDNNSRCSYDRTIDIKRRHYRGYNTIQHRLPHFIHLLPCRQLRR